MSVRLSGRNILTRWVCLEKQRTLTLSNAPGPCTQFLVQSGFLGFFVCVDLDISFFVDVVVVVVVVCISLSCHHWITFF